MDAPAHIGYKSVQLFNPKVIGTFALGMALRPADAPNTCQAPRLPFLATPAESFGATPQAMPDPSWHVGKLIRDFFAAQIDASDQS
jgi:hypothetical protein